MHIIWSKTTSVGNRRQWQKITENCTWGLEKKQWRNFGCLKTNFIHPTPIFISCSVEDIITCWKIFTYSTLKIVNFSLIYDVPSCASHFTCYLFNFEIKRFSCTACRIHRDCTNQVTPLWLKAVITFKWQGARVVPKEK